MDIEFHSPKEVRMFSRIKNSLGLALLLSLMTSIAVFAKGGFSFITVAGAGLKESVRITDAALTEGFFTFANFYEDRVDAPANPGEGYEITRYYLDGKREIAFDRLHYYPVTGFVFYDGIVNGESEYDSEWYTSNPKIAVVLEGALLTPTQAPTTILQSRTVNAIGQAGTPAPQNQAMTMGIAIVAGLAAVFGFAYWFCKPAVQ